MNTYAKIVADSTANDIRLTTLECYYPLMIHAQAKTHRILSLDDECYIETVQSVGLMDDPMLSRNAQSNRAMPVAKVIEQVEYDPAMPSHWGKNQAGMQAYEELKSDEGNWRIYAKNSASFAKSMASRGYHKQIVNRLTMPFQYIKVIVTATEWDNFFKLRLNDADPTMMELAGKMKEAMGESIPVELRPGQWHLPYITLSEFENPSILTEDLVKCSVARCARVSYNNHDNSSPDIDKDIALADRLLEAGHMSPFEHCLTPMMHLYEGDLTEECGEWPVGYTHCDRDGAMWSSNMRGWIQYRNLL